MALYDILLNNVSESFVVAKLDGFQWGVAELGTGFEIISQIVNESDYDYDVIINASWGNITVLASDIDPLLISKVAVCGNSKYEADESIWEDCIPNNYDDAIDRIASFLKTHTGIQIPDISNDCYEDPSPIKMHEKIDRIAAFISEHIADKII